ncbi:MAG: SRPBCC family protein [Bacteroidota bacterium]
MPILKTTLATLLLFIAFFDVHSQQTGADITLTKVVDASADDVWEVLRQLDNIDELTEVVSTVEFTGNYGAGGTRVCTSADGNGAFKESILSLDDDARTYTYELLEGAPIEGMVNNFKVVDLGYRKSMIVWTSKYEAFIINPQMTEEQFLGFINQTATEMIGNVASMTSLN